jgi:hypothetical protein
MSATTTTTRPDLARFARIPLELTELPRWVLWRYEGRGSERTKIPYQPSGAKAKADDPSTWCAYTAALQAYAEHPERYEGIGFELGDGFCGVDLDNALDDGGELKVWAQPFAEAIGSYGEISPSGRGVKFICRGSLPTDKTGIKRSRPNGAPKEAVEMYQRGRYFALTGKIWHEQTAIVDCTDPLARIFAEIEEWSRRKPAGVNGNGHHCTADDRRVERAARYVAKMPAAISGQRGHDATFAVACEIWRFGLSDTDAWALLCDFNRRCEPQWSEHELRHKLESARETVNVAGEFGERLREDRHDGNGHTSRGKAPTAQRVAESTADDTNASADDVLDRKAPLAIARRFIGDCFAHVDCPTLLFTDDEFHRFNGVNWEVIERAAIRRNVYEYLEPRKVSVTRGDTTEILPFKPTHRDVDGVIDALKAAAYSPVRSPAWTGDTANLPDPAQLIVATNGVFTLGHTGAEKVCDPTPRLFTLNSLDYGFLTTAAPPLKWLAFLADIFDDDQQQIELLQEWFGYVLTADTRLQKMLLLIGPPRSG